MPQSTHNKLAELHNIAGHNPSAAAIAHGKGDQLTTYELSKEAHELSTNARSYPRNSASQRSIKPTPRPQRLLFGASIFSKSEQ